MKDSFSSRLKKVFKKEKAKTQKKNVPRSFQMPDDLFYVENWAPPFYQSSSQSAYERAINSYWTEACLEKYKSAIALVRPVCQKWDQTTENWVRVPDHPIEQRIDTPNEYQTTAEFFSIIIENLWLNGNALITIRDTRSSGTVRLEALNTDLVKMNISEVEGKLVDGYDVYKEGWGTGSTSRKKFVPRQNMIHIRLANSERLEWGISPLEAIKNVQETEADAIEYNRSFMRNNGRAPFIISCEEPLQKHQMKAIQHAVADSVSGRSVGLPIVLGYGMKPYAIGNTPVDIDYIKADRLNGERIASIFQIPAPLININENATLANVKEFVKLFWTAGVVPKLYTIYQAISKYWVHPRFGEDYRLWFDLTAIPELMDFTKSKAELLDMFANYGWSANELNVALELGLPHNPMGDIRRYNTSDSRGQVIDWANVEPPMLPSDSTGDEGTEPNIEAVAAKFRKARSESGAYSKEQLDAIWIKTELSRKILEDIFRQKVLDTIRNDYETLANFPVESLTGGPALDRWAKTARENWTSLIDRIWYDSAKYFMDSFNEVYSKDLKSKYLESKAEYTPQNVREISRIAQEKAEFIVDTTTHYIIEFVSDLISKGFSDEEIVDRLREEIPELSQFRAQVIVENEVVAAGNHGNSLAAEKSGIYTEKTWHTRRDNRVRPTHVTMEGETRLLSQRYSNKLRYPGDPEGPAKEIINCRCFETYA